MHAMFDFMVLIIVKISTVSHTNCSQPFAEVSASPEPSTNFQNADESFPKTSSLPPPITLTMMDFRSITTLCNCMYTISAVPAAAVLTFSEFSCLRQKLKKDQYIQRKVPSQSTPPPRDM
jgi:hypothetical protein